MNLYLDAEDPKHFEGRYINDSRGSDFRTNVRFAANYRTNTCSKTGHKWVRIYASRKIRGRGRGDISWLWERLLADDEHKQCGGRGAVGGASGGPKLPIWYHPDYNKDPDYNTLWAASAAPPPPSYYLTPTTHNRTSIHRHQHIDNLILGHYTNNNPTQNTPLTSSSLSPIVQHPHHIEWNIHPYTI